MTDAIVDFIQKHPILTHTLTGIGGAYLFRLYLLANGYLPLWFGPERRDWSQRYWTGEANDLMEKLEYEQGYYVHKPQESNRNFLSVIQSTPDRRVRRALFYNRALSKLIGVLHFGADCEGPPRCVHGGCIAAIADAVLGVAAVQTTFMPCVTANLSVDYVEKLPLGSTCLIEVQHVSSDGVLIGDKENVGHPSLSRKLVFDFKISSISGNSVYCRGSGIFINAMIPNPERSLLPPVLRFRL